MLIFLSILNLLSCIAMGCIAGHAIGRLKTDSFLFLMLFMLCWVIHSIWIIIKLI
jgi:hypothetical protein